MSTSASTLTMRPFDRAEIPLLHAALTTHADLVLWSGTQLHWPLTQDQLRSYVDNANVDHMILSAVADHDTVVGHASVRVTPAHRSARIGRVLVYPDHRGRGYGAALMTAVLDIIFGQRGLHRASLGVFQHNARALGLYERLGFTREGVLRDVALVDGEWWPLVEMGLLETEYQQPRVDPRP
ncbi:GNAT family protein [Lipingzhangella sp. LS1_29]|uniref:GNAT family protein n=1 Tax=Lipingzhangella rawalii TaxID=2055835 RepID=A0ABU2H0S4_9ACTN|nr:GNAT family protein [Lipingzhangella rawalii]MDS1268908.1 GNAT family protein [Lipingzhangella rawalii]